ncbi:fimbrial protein [Metapseudomonas otitidis]|uniref:Fimbrial protein n=1 Tax=Metapseudomonas otitidis TaxID=319939 RepID=A0A6S5RJC2_9GAMM|nr:fimbrial protein [Pseudomonas otitidis]BBT14517.1 fimbrial protein [Pseudomonas otitidis]
MPLLVMAYMVVRLRGMLSDGMRLGRWVDFTPLFPPPVIRMKHTAFRQMAGALGLLLISSVAWGASCTAGKDVQPLRTNHTLPAVITQQRDAPVGTVLYDTNGWIGGGRNLDVSCAGPGTVWMTDGFRGGMVKTAFEHVYESGVPGIGIKVAWANNGRNPPSSMSGGRYMVDPPSELQISATTYVPAQLWWIQLIKTGPIQSGTFKINPARVFYHNLLTNELTFTPSQVVFNKQGCRVQNSDFTVPMPTANLQRFQSIGSTTGERAFDITLDCDPDIRISYMLDGIDGAASVLKNSTGPGMAQGVGVQLLKGIGSTPLVLGAKAYHMDMGMIGGLSKIPLVARYYQLGSSVTPGKVITTATLTMFYE